MRWQVIPPFRISQSCRLYSPGEHTVFEWSITFDAGTLARVLLYACQKWQRFAEYRERSVAWAGILDFLRRLSDLPVSTPVVLLHRLQ
jgi:hypothetical protein